MLSFENKLIFRKKRILSVVFLFGCLCTLVLPGCEGIGRVAIDNPVMGPPPPRVVSQSDIELDKQNYAQLTPVQQAGGIDSGRVVQTNGTGEFASRLTSRDENSQIVATVNGTPILAGEVLEPFQRFLVEGRKKLSPEDYQKQRLAIIKKHLPVVLEQQMLIEALKAKVNKEQMESFDSQLDEDFAKKEIPRLLRKTKLDGVEQLEAQLHRGGSSLEKLRRAYGKRQMAMFYLFDSTNANQVLSRADLLEYYRSHVEEFSHPARVRWREIRVSHEKHGGKTEAAHVVKEVITQLKQGVDFGDVARKYSDSATAEVGGLWGWTLQDSLADQKIGDLLFTLPVGQISDVYLGKDHFRLIKVVEREEASITPLGELQGKIEKKITEKKRVEETERVIKELKSSIIVRTMFDEQQP